MKICPQCKKGYPDHQEACFECGSKLTEISEMAFFEMKISGFTEKIIVEFQKIENRLGRLEKSLHMRTYESEKLVASPVPRTVKPVDDVSQLQRPIKPIEPATMPKEAAKQKDAQKGDIETTIGLVWLNRIGILALLVGAAFFLKYAFDNKWIGELGRVVLGIMAGFGLIAGSEVARKKNYDVISQGLHGGGVAMLYLSIFASFGFYHIIGLMPAFIFMSIVTLYCGFWSTRNDWISSAVIGIAGGFLTLFLLGIERISPTLLFSYVLLLDLGVLYISLYKKWVLLNIGSLVLTHIVFYYWFSTSYKPENLILTLVFASIFFGTFCLLSILRNLIHKEKSDISDIVLVLLNGPVYFSELFNILKPNAVAFPGLLPLALGCIYILYSYSALNRCKEDKDLIISYVSLAIFFVTISIPIQLRYCWVTIGWAVEGLLLIWMGLRLENEVTFKPVCYFYRRIGLAISGISVFKLLFFDYSGGLFFYAKYKFILNERFFTYMVAVAVIFCAAWLYKKNKDKVNPEEKILPTFLVILANSVFLLQLSIESNVFFTHTAYAQAIATAGMGKQLTGEFFSRYGSMFSARGLSVSVLWIIYALIAIAAGIYRKFRALRIMALILFGLAVLKIFVFDLSELDKIYRIISFMSLGFVLLIASFFYQRYKDEILSFALKD